MFSVFKFPFASALLFGGISLSIVAPSIVVSFRDLDENDNDFLS